MNQRLSRSANARLLVLLIILIAVIVFFLAMYLRGYFAYYKELYDYRKNLIASLTGQEETYAKPFYKAGDPYAGNLTAKITIFEFGDLSCQACKSIQPELEKVRQFYGNERLLHVWKDMPITGANNNIEAHQAVHCAFDQGKFFEYKTVLYEKIGEYTTEVFNEAARKTGLDANAFSECLSSKKYQPVVEQNYREALRIGLDATPTLYVNGQRVDSGYTFENIRNIIERTR